MMKSWDSVFLASLALCLAACNTETMKVTELKPIPDAAYAKGVSAPFCGVAGDVLVVAGGANFPDKSLLEGGAKRVYADIWAKAPASRKWVHAGVLPDSTAYGATFAVDGALILSGGNVCGETTDKVYELRLRYGKAVLRTLPQLPVPMEQCGWTRDGDRLYLVGGVGTTGVYACTIGDYVWSKVADLPEPLVQPVAFASGGKLYVWGGFNPETLEVSDRGLCLEISPLASLGRNDKARFDGRNDTPSVIQNEAEGSNASVIPSGTESGNTSVIPSGTESGNTSVIPSGTESGNTSVILSGAEGGVEESLWRKAPAIPDGGTFVGATGATLPDGRLAVVGGVNRAIFARALHNTPEDRIPYLSKEPAEYQFRQAVYAFDPATETWAQLTSDPACALAGPGVAVMPAPSASGPAAPSALYVAGGELKPGVRSPKIFTLRW